MVKDTPTREPLLADVTALCPHLTPTSLNLPEKLTEARWLEIGVALARVDSARCWWVGDWWVHGTHHYGSRTTIVDAMSWTGPNSATCANYATVARRFPESSCRHELLTFEHHRLVSALDADAAAALAWCEEPVAAGGKPRTTGALRTHLEMRKLKPIRFVTTVEHVKHVVRAPAAAAGERFDPASRTEFYVPPRPSPPFIDMEPEPGEEPASGNTNAAQCMPISTRGPLYVNAYTSPEAAAQTVLNWLTPEALGPFRAGFIGEKYLLVNKAEVRIAIARTLRDFVPDDRYQEALEGLFAAVVSLAEEQSSAAGDAQPVGPVEEG